MKRSGRHEACPYISSKCHPHGECKPICRAEDLRMLDVITHYRLDVRACNSETLALGCCCSKL